MTFAPIEKPDSQAAQDVDANINAQDADEDELLSDVELATVAVTGQKRPWLRTASLYKAVGYRGPAWLTAQENWVYLVIVALIAGGLYWHFKKK